LIITDDILTGQTNIGSTQTKLKTAEDMLAQQNFERSMSEGSFMTTFREDDDDFTEKISKNYTDVHNKRI
jgi:dihydroxyacetone kinase DhaKLM complex PTS-EIIA-like component DhaM